MFNAISQYINQYVTYFILPFWNNYITNNATLYRPWRFIIALALLYYLISLSKRLFRG